MASTIAQMAELANALALRAVGGISVGTGFIPLETKDAGAKGLGEGSIKD